MRIIIIPADLNCQREVIIETVRRHLTDRSDHRRFEWLYMVSPHRGARAWLAIDRDADSVVGMAAAFPRRFWAGDSEVMAWVFGDFCLDNGYRTLGPALQLQKACLAAADASGVAFCYDFPSQSMLAIYQRLGLRPWKQMIRLAKPLRVDRKVRKLTKNAVIAKSFSVVGNYLLARLDQKKYGDETITFALHAGQCSAEFSELEQQISGRYGISIRRSAEYLNWRYLSNPLYRYELFTARVADDLVAYGVFYVAGEDATLVDLFGIDEGEVISGLVASLSDLLRKRGVTVVSAPLIESHPFRAILERLGFKARESSPIVVYSPQQSSIQFEQTDWFLMHGDRDS